MHMPAQLDNFIKAKHDFAADHEKIKAAVDSDLSKVDILAETKYFTDFAEYFR